MLAYSKEREPWHIRTCKNDVGCILCLRSHGAKSKMLLRRKANHLRVLTLNEVN